MSFNIAVALLSTVLNSTCSDFYHGTGLHIAASNLCLGAVKCLLEHGANPSVRVSMMINAWVNQPNWFCYKSTPFILN